MPSFVLFIDEGVILCPTFQGKSKRSDNLAPEDLAIFQNKINSLLGEENAQKQDGAINVNVNGNGNTTNVVTGNNNAIVNGSVTNSSGQVAIGNNNEQNQGAFSGVRENATEKSIPKSNKTTEKKEIKNKDKDKNMNIDKNKKDKGGYDIHNPRHEFTIPTPGDKQTDKPKDYKYSIFFNRMPGPSVEYINGKFVQVNKSELQKMKDQATSQLGKFAIANKTQIIAEINAAGSDKQIKDILNKYQIGVSEAW